MQYPKTLNSTIIINSLEDIVSGSPPNYHISTNTNTTTTTTTTTNNSTELCLGVCNKYYKHKTVNNNMGYCKRCYNKIILDKLKLLFKDPSFDEVNNAIIKIKNILNINDNSQDQNIKQALLDHIRLDIKTINNEIKFGIDALTIIRYGWMDGCSKIDINDYLLQRVNMIK